MIGRVLIALLAANLIWLAWSQGWLRGVGLGPAEPTEPERVQQQLQPETLRVQALDASATPAPSSSPPPAAAPAPTVSVEEVPAENDSQGNTDSEATTTVAEAPASAAQEPASPAPASAAPAPAPEPAPASKPAPAVATACWQAGVFDERQAANLRQALAGLPNGSWRLEEVQLPGRWMVYIGKLADADAVAAKRAELRALGVDTDRPGAALEPGLSLGRFSSEEAAQRALTELGRKGVRTARVVQERRNSPAYRLRLPNADDSLRRQVRGMRNALAGRELRRCD